MADSILPEIREPALVRPMETSARDALRRFSYHSHRDQSIAPSTRSLSYTNYPTTTQSKPPSRVPSLRPPLLLHTTNPDDVEEQMDIAADTGIPFGYFDHTEVTPKPARQRTFLGGFFSGFKRLPRVLRHGTRRARKGTDATQGTHLTGNTLPVYKSAPSTPVVPGADNTDRTILAAQYLHGTGALHRNEPDVPPSLFPGHGRNPSLHISPPTVSEHGIEDEVSMPQPDPAPAPGFPPDTRQTFDQSTFADQATAIPVPSSPHPTRSPATTRHDILSPHAGHASSFHEDDEIPVSVHAHPQPSQDYRRMSKTYTLTGNTTVTSMSSSEPSFASELNGVQRFFSALKNMPWVASDRLTEDYRPGTQRGGWAWKRVSVLSTKSASIIQNVRRRRSRRHSTRKPNLRKRFSFKPVQKPLASWYTDLSGKSAGTIEKGLPRPSWAASPELRRDRLDLLSSGTGTRSSVLSSSERTGMSSPPITPISPRSHYVERRRHPLHSTPKLRPGIRTKPRPEQDARQQRHGDHHLDRRYQQETRRGERDHRSPRLSPPSRTDTPYPSTYPHAYLPSSQAQYQNSPPMVPVPIVVPQYVMQAPSPNLNTHPIPSDQPEPSSHTPSPGHIAAPSPMSFVPAVYMGLPILHPEGSPPGLAGRGAYGGSPPVSHSGFIPGYLPPS